MPQFVDPEKYVFSIMKFLFLSIGYLIVDFLVEFVTLHADLYLSLGFFGPFFRGISVIGWPDPA